MRSILAKYLQFKPFTNEEAWMLFKVAAIAEAVGWTILIIGIVVERYVLPGNQISVPLAGSIHGTIFMVYLVAVLVLSPSLSWRPTRIAAALICSVPPYGTLVFEQWAVRERETVKFKQFCRLVLLRQIT